MATNTTTTPDRAHEARYAHTAVSSAFRGMLRAAERAITAEQSLEGAEAMHFDPALSEYLTAAEAAWAELEEAVEAALRAPSRRAADVALKQVARVWQAGLTAREPITLHFLALRCQQTPTLFHLPARDAATQAVNHLLQEAAQMLAAFFALERVLVSGIETDDDPEPDPFHSRMLAA